MCQKKKTHHVIASNKGLDEACLHANKRNYNYFNVSDASTSFKNKTTAQTQDGTEMRTEASNYGVKNILSCG